MAERNEGGWHRDAMVFESLLNSFPKQQTASKRIKAVHRISDGSRLTWTLSLSYRPVGLPFGADRELLRWLVQRALALREGDVSWEVLLKYLGPDPTAVEKEGLYFAARRLGVANATWRREDGSWGGFNFISTQVSTCGETSIAADATGEFLEETKFIFDLVFLLFVDGTQLQQNGTSPASGPSDCSPPDHVAARPYAAFRQISIIDPETAKTMPRDITKLERL